MSHLVRRLATLISVPALMLGLVSTPASATHTTTRFPTRIELPNGFQPEGIAIARGTAYFGSRADGDIFAVDLKTGAGKVISQGPGTLLHARGPAPGYVPGADPGPGGLTPLVPGTIT